MAENALVMPKVGESVTEGTVLRWLKAEGDMVEEDEPVVEVETEKVNVEIPSRWAGRLRITVPEGEQVKVEEPLAFIETAAEAASITAPSPVPAVSTAATRAEAPARLASIGGAGGEDGSGATRYSPAVLSLAREHKLDLSRVHGSGLFGRVTRKDVLAFIESATTQERPPEATPPEKASSEAGELVPLTATRRTIARRMVRSVQTIPHVWLMIEADVTGLVRLRQSVKEEFAARERVELSFLPFFIKAAVEGLKDYPVFNSSWSDDGVILKKDLNIGVAVSTAQGLVVPVIQRADALSIAGIARRLVDLADRARSRTLRIDDVEGGTFTIDNTGSFGSVASVPIINHPQAAIMTVEAIIQRPVVVNDAIAIRHIVNLCLSFDHRVTDGAEAGAFLTAVKNRVEAFGPDSPLF